MTETIKKASDLINSKTGYCGPIEGMSGYAVLSVIDENGYPTASTNTISTADGINQVTFLTGMASNKVTRLQKNNKACVILASPDYNINLVGEVEISNDLETKRLHWQPLFEAGGHGSIESPDVCVLIFKTKRYSIYFAESEELFEEGVL